MSELTPSQVFSFASAAVEQNPALMAHILSGIAHGFQVREEALRTKLSNANDVVTALAMAADARSTPGLKAHMEFVALRHFKPHLEGECQAVVDYVAARTAENGN